jgi:multisubunit Na+/H+ antiporter MnhE subunit
MGTLARWALWWLVLALLWLLYQGEYNRIEQVAAACAATLAATVAVLVWRQERTSVRLELHWLRRAAAVPWQVLREFGLLTVFLVRTLLRRRVPPTGGFRTLPFPTGGARPAERGRRAFAALAMTYSPNSYVVDMDEDEHAVVVHTLSPVPPGQERL